MGNNDAQRAQLDINVEVAQRRVTKIGETLSEAYAELNAAIAERGAFDRTRQKCQWCHDYFEPERLAAHAPQCEADYRAGVGVV